MCQNYKVTNIPTKKVSMYLKSVADIIQYVQIIVKMENNKKILYYINKFYNNILFNLRANTQWARNQSKAEQNSKLRVNEKMRF